MNLSELKVPGPTMTALSAPFWAAVNEARFILQRCEDCGRWVFYPRMCCPRCWSPRLAWHEASGRGKLATWSAIHRPGHPGWEPAAPYFIGIVELAEGPTMLSHLMVQEPHLSMPLRVALTRVGDQVLPCFEAAE